MSVKGRAGIPLRYVLRRALALVTMLPKPYRSTFSVLGGENDQPTACEKGGNDTDTRTPPLLLPYA